MKNKIYTIIMLLIFIGANTNNAMAFENNDKEDVNIVEESSETKKYLISIGQRNFGTKGISLEYQTNSYAIENIVNVEKQAFYYTALYKKVWHHSKIKGLNAFYGIGTHFYLNNNDFEQSELAKRKGLSKEKGYQIFGLDFIAGLSYKTPKLPIKVSVDLKPSMDIFIKNESNGRYFYKDLAGITIAYQF